MYSQNDISGVYSFLKSTGEGNLRKMLVNGPLTEVHFRVLLKIAKGVDESKFIEAFNNEGIPVKLSPKEKPVKETFWPTCKAKLAEVGLLGLAQAA